MKRTLKYAAAAALTGILILSAAPVALARDAPKGRWLKIRVYPKGSGTPSVLVNLPMSLVSAAARILARSGAHATIDLPVHGEGEEACRARRRDVDIQEFLKELEAMAPGQIVEVQEDDERVTIRIE